MLTQRRQFKLAGLLCLLSAFLTPVFIWAQLWLGKQDVWQVLPLTAGLSILQLVLTYYPLSKYRELLVSRASVKQMNPTITVLLFVLVLMSFVQVLPRPGMIFGINIDRIMELLFFTAATGYYVLGYQTITISSDLYGYRKIFGVVLMVFGLSGLLEPILSGKIFMYLSSGTGIVVKVVMGLLFWKVVQGNQKVEIP